MKKGGYHGRYLMVNLSDKSWEINELPDQIASDYLGGRGIGTTERYRTFRRPSKSGSAAG